MLLWGLAFDDLNELLSPLHDRYDPADCRQAFLAFMEGLAIALLSLFRDSRSHKSLREYDVATAKLSPSFVSTNRASGLVVALDLGIEAQSRRGKLAKVAYGARLGYDNGESLSLSEYQAAIDPEGAHASRVKVSSQRYHHPNSSVPH